MYHDTTQEPTWGAELLRRTVKPEGKDGQQHCARQAAKSDQTTKAEQTKVKTTITGILTCSHRRFTV